MHVSDRTAAKCDDPGTVVSVWNTDGIFRRDSRPQSGQNCETGNKMPSGFSLFY
jgi:hypothetical protein